jgi:hypothetical protein
MLPIIWASLEGQSFWFMALVCSCFFPDISGIVQTQILLMGGLCAGASVQFSPQRSLFGNPGYSRRRSTILVTFAESAASKSTQRQTMPVSRVMPAT